MSERELLDEKAKCSGRVSEQCRYIGFGLTIVCFTLFTSTSPFSVIFVKQYLIHLVCSTILGCLALIFDIVQYMAGYRSANIALKAGESTGTYQYNSETWSYQIRAAAYWLKQICIVIGSIWLIIMMMIAINSIKL